ncbi:putative oxidoreductase [Stanieria sp. NIES-3757]|nr:putative oxidoreductase [Stanieria sp. NIES-3757]
MENLVDALQAFRDVLGTQNVLSDEATVSAAETGTYFTTEKVLAVIKPGDRNEVQACVKIANQYQVAIYPISTGKNWGYGSRVPTQDSSVIMDLGRLNRIVDYNEKLAYVTIEPGVTQRQLFDFLQQQNSNLYLSVTGSTPDSSLIGNILERGVAKGPLGDRFSHVCALEVVLPTGECIHTGLSRFGNAKAAKVNRWGVGPYFDGIFTQSNLGIVTELTMWLIPYPRYFQSFFYAINDDSRLEALVDTLRELKLQGLLKNSFVIFNDHRMLSTRQQYPWQETNGKTPLPTELMAKLRQQWGGGAWVGEGALYSVSREQGRIERKLIQKALKNKVDKLIFFDHSKARITELIQPLAKKLLKIDLNETLDVLFRKNPQRGVPTEKTMPMVYWRKQSPVPSHAQMNPDLDGCGVIWLAPSLPFDGQHTRKALNIIKQIAKQYQFEPNVGLQCVTERSIDLTVTIMYDRELPGEDQRALGCHDEMFQKLALEGYIPYRLSTRGMKLLPSAQDDYSQLLQQIKEALDPNNILAPGRYDFRQDWSVNEVRSMCYEK